jgi:hypothetical protein
MNESIVFSYLVQCTFGSLWYRTNSNSHYTRSLAQVERIVPTNQVVVVFGSRGGEENSRGPTPVTVRQGLDDKEAVVSRSQIFVLSETRLSASSRELFWEPDLTDVDYRVTGDFHSSRTADRPSRNACIIIARPVLPTPRFAFHVR